MNTDIQIRDYSKKFYYGGEKEWHHGIKEPDALNDLLNE